MGTPFLVVGSPSSASHESVSVRTLQSGEFIILPLPLPFRSVQLLQLLMDCPDPLPVQPPLSGNRRVTKVGARSSLPALVEIASAALDKGLIEW